MTANADITAAPTEFVPTVQKARLPSIEAPTNWDGLLAFCTDISKSGLVPTSFKDKPADLAIAVSMGNELGLHWTHAIQSIAVINGRPSLWGDGLLAVIMAHPDFEWIDENESDETKGVTIIKRKGMPPRRYEFTLEMARQAGLLGKDTYKQNPGRMLQRRSRARCGQDTFADALKGIGTADDAAPELLVGSGSAVDEPKPKAKEVQERLAARSKPANAAATEPAKPAPVVVDGATGEILDPDAIVNKLTEAKTAEELTAAADLARSIKDEAKKAEANAAYKASLKRIREAKPKE